MIKDHHHSPLRDPVMGIGGNGVPDAPREQSGSGGGTREPEFLANQQPSPKDGIRINLPALILTVGLFSVFCLGLGFVAGQELGTKRFTTDLSTETKKSQSDAQRQEKHLELLRSELKTSLALVHSKLDQVAANGSNQAGNSGTNEYQMIASELQGKLDATHQLFAGMTELPGLMGRVSQLLSRWEERKVSIVEEICPASDGIPRRYPGKK